MNFDFDISNVDSIRKSIIYTYQYNKHQMGYRTRTVSFIYMYCIAHKLTFVFPESSSTNLSNHKVIFRPVLGQQLFTPMKYATKRSPFGRGNCLLESDLNGATLQHEFGH